MDLVAIKSAVKNALHDHPHLLDFAESGWRRSRELTVGFGQTSQQGTMTRQERILRRKLGISTSMRKTLLDSKSF
jgi:hypothetical protein